MLLRALMTVYYLKLGSTSIHFERSCMENKHKQHAQPVKLTHVRKGNGMGDNCCALNHQSAPDLVAVGHW